MSTAPFRLAVSGSRHLTDFAFVAAKLGKLSTLRRPNVVVLHGGCRGCDELAGRWATEGGLRVEVFEADWERWGKRAGPLRNRAMVETADALVAFRTPDSLGTTDCVGAAVTSAGKVPVVVFDIEVDGAGLVTRLLGTCDYNRRPLDPATNLPANLAYRG